jgi:8-oxo-dGTP pyrophosphatase MutT (NUDIX family)
MTTVLSKKAACVVAVHFLTGEVLGATRRGTDDDWGIIGGKIDDGETALVAAMREFHEETGVDLYSRPALVGTFKDEQDWDITVYAVKSEGDLMRIAHRFNGPPIEVEPGIKVGFVPYAKLMEKTFAQFNVDLIGPLLLTLLQKAS